MRLNCHSRCCRSGSCGGCSACDHACAAWQGWPCAGQAGARWAAAGLGRARAEGHSQPEAIQAIALLLCVYTWVHEALRLEVRMGWACDNHVGLNRLPVSASRQNLLSRSHHVQQADEMLNLQGKARCVDTPGTWQWHLPHLKLASADLSGMHSACAPWRAPRSPLCWPPSPRAASKVFHDENSSWQGQKPCARGPPVGQSATTILLVRTLRAFLTEDRKPTYLGRLKGGRRGLAPSCCLHASCRSGGWNAPAQPGRAAQPLGYSRNTLL